MFRWEPLRGEIRIAVDDIHRFGTDALLLARFAAGRAGERIVDLGTGCGAVALRLCADTSPAAVIGIDLDPDAVALARRSADALRETASADRAVPEFRVADWNDPAAVGQAGSFDRVVCNPPYFPAGTGKPSADPARRLARHETADTLPSVCRAAATLLRAGGSFCLCHRPERLTAVFAALTAVSLEPKRLVTVQQDPTKPPFLVLIEARRNGRPGLTVEPPLCLRDAAGNATALWKDLYGESL